MSLHTLLFTPRDIGDAVPLFAYVSEGASEWTDEMEWLDISLAQLDLDLEAAHGAHIQAQEALNKVNTMKQRLQDASVITLAGKTAQAKQDQIAALKSKIRDGENDLRRLERTQAKSIPTYGVRTA